MIGKKGARHKGLVLRSGTRVSAALQRVFEVAHFLREKPLSRGGSGVQLFWNGYSRQSTPPEKDRIMTVGPPKTASAMPG
jgi:hypothetical protein